MKAHPHMTMMGNHYVFVMDEGHMLHARKVTIEENKSNNNIEFMPYQIGS